MSPALRYDCAYEMNKTWIVYIKFLSRVARLPTGPALLIELCDKLFPRSFGAGELFGDISHMYILIAGRTLRTNALGSNISCLFQQSVWGEDHLLLTNRLLLSDNTARCLSY